MTSLHPSRAGTDNLVRYARWKRCRRSLGSTPRPVIFLKVLVSVQELACFVGYELNWSMKRRAFFALFPNTETSEKKIFSIRNVDTPWHRIWIGIYFFDAIWACIWRDFRVFCVNQQLQHFISCALTYFDWQLRSFVFFVRTSWFLIGESVFFSFRTYVKLLFDLKIRFLDWWISFSNSNVQGIVTDIIDFRSFHAYGNFSLSGPTVRFRQKIHKLSSLSSKGV